MQPFHVLLDAPERPVSRIQIATLGDYTDQRYGEFSITRDDVEAWRRNLEYLPGHRALIDLDHRADRQPRNTEAAGWITDVGWDGDTPVATVEWTPIGEQSIAEKRYLFFSPTYGEHTTDDGTVHENTLIGGALTNRPFLSGMPAITLASAERLTEAIDSDPALRFHQRALDGEFGEHTQALLMLDVSAADRKQAVKDNNALPDGSYPIRNAKQLRAAAVLAASKHGDWQAAKKLIRRRAKELGVDISTLPGFASEKPSDSRRTMSTETETPLDLDELRKTLGLKKDADPVKILEAATTAAEAQAKLEKGLDKKPVKTLEQQAKDAGLVLLDSKAVIQLQAQAEAGANAMRQLQEERFDRAFGAALEARKVIPEQQETYRTLYAKDADLALKMLDEAPAVLPAKPFGDPVLQLDTDADPEQIAAAGIHPGSHQLHQQISKYMLDNKIPQAQYHKVMEQVASGAVVL